MPRYPHFPDEDTEDQSGCKLEPGSNQAAWSQVRALHWGTLLGFSVPVI